MKSNLVSEMDICKTVPIPREDASNDTSCAFLSHPFITLLAERKTKAIFICTHLINSSQLFGTHESLVAKYVSKHFRCKELKLNGNGANRLWRAGIFIVSCSLLVSKSLWTRHSLVEHRHFKNNISDKDEWTNFNQYWKALHSSHARGTITAALLTFAFFRTCHTNPVPEQQF